MNKIFLLGRLCQNPGISQSSNNVTVCKFMLAVDKPYKENRPNGEDTADFIPCVAFGRTAENIQKYFQKGNRIAVQGRLSTSTYEKDGKKQYSYSIEVSDFDFCESAR